MTRAIVADGDEVLASDAELDYYVKVWGKAVEMSGHLRVARALFDIHPKSPTLVLFCVWVDETLAEFKKLEEGRP